jgi:hypothetical protein
MLDPAIKNRLESLGPEYRSFVLSDFAPEVAQQFGTTAKLNDDQKTMLSNGIVLYLLVFLNLDELVKFITRNCGLGRDESVKLVSAIMSTLPDWFIGAHKETMAGIESGKNGTVTPKPPTPPQTSSRIRTMKEDMQQAQKDEPTYSSTQAAILGESSQPRPPASPRWDTDKQ